MSWRFSNGSFRPPPFIPPAGYLQYLTFGPNSNTSGPLQGLSVSIY